MESFKEKLIRWLVLGKKEDEGRMARKVPVSHPDGRSNLWVASINGLSLYSSQIVDKVCVAVNLRDDDDIARYFEVRRSGGIIDREARSRELLRSVSAVIARDEKRIRNGAIVPFMHDCVPNDGKSTTCRKLWLSVWMDTCDFGTNHWVISSRKEAVSWYAN